MCRLTLRMMTLLSLVNRQFESSPVRMGLSTSHDPKHMSSKLGCSKYVIVHDNNNDVVLEGEKACNHEGTNAIWMCQLYI